MRLQQSVSKSTSCLFDNLLVQAWTFSLSSDDWLDLLVLALLLLLRWSLELELHWVVTLMVLEPSGLVALFEVFIEAVHAVGHVNLIDILMEPLWRLKTLWPHVVLENMPSRELYDLTEGTKLIEDGLVDLISELTNLLLTHMRKSLRVELDLLAVDLWNIFELLHLWLKNIWVLVDSHLDVDVLLFEHIVLFLFEGLSSDQSSPSFTLFKEVIHPERDIDLFLDKVDQACKHLHEGKEVETVAIVVEGGLVSGKVREQEQMIHAD